MRILHVIPGIARRYGGPSTAISSMVNALNRLSGVIAEVATTDADGPRRHLSRKDTPEGITTHLFPMDYSERWKFSSGLWQWLRRHVAEYDIVHTHALWSFSTAAAASAARRAGVPYIIRPAGMLSQYTWGRRSVSKRVYWSLIEGRNVRKAAGFHATSAEEAQEIESVCPGARILVVPNGVEDVAWTTPVNTHELRKRCGAAVGNRPIALFFSRLHPKKGLTDLLLPAIANLRSEAFLAIAGGADDHAPGYEAEVRATIARLGLSERATLLGPVDGETRWSLFDGAAVFVLPSHAENFGIVVAEAMARGCPVVVTEGVQAAHHVTAAAAGLVVPFAVEPLTVSLDNVLSDAAWRQKLGEAGREYATRHFMWSQVALELRHFYEGCLELSNEVVNR